MDIKIDPEAIDSAIKAATNINMEQMRRNTSVVIDDSITDEINKASYARSQEEFLKRQIATLKAQHQDDIDRIEELTAQMEEQGRKGLLKDIIIAVISMVTGAFLNAIF